MAGPKNTQHTHTHTCRCDDVKMRRCVTWLTSNTKKKAHNNRNEEGWKSGGYLYPLFSIFLFFILVSCRRSHRHVPLESWIHREYFVMFLWCDWCVCGCPPSSSSQSTSQSPHPPTHIFLPFCPSVCLVSRYFFHPKVLRVFPYLARCE